MKKTIVLLDHYVGSPDMGMEFRPYYMAQEWSKLGYNVRLVGGSYSHLRMKNPIVTRDFQNEEIEGIFYTWVKTNPYRGNGLGRTLSMILFTGKLWINGKKLAKDWKPDIIIASSTYPLDTYVAQKIAKYTGATVIHEIHDMWPSVLTGIYGMKKWNPFVICMQMAENSFCKNSDYIVSLQPNTKKYLMKHGMTIEKFRNINNGVVYKEWENPLPLPEKHKQIFQQLRNDKKFVIGFFGSITKSYALDYLIKAVQQLKNENIVTVIVGDDNQYSLKLKHLAGGDSNRTIYFLPKVPKLAIPSLLEQFDALYIASIDNRVMKFGISMNKLFDSMMSGKPILYAMGAPNNYVKQFGCGISVNPESVDALVTGMDQLYHMTDEERAVMGSKGRKAVMENFTYEKLAARFAELFH